MFKKNTAVTGFAVGFINATTGAAVTTGTPTGTVTLDGGTQAAIAGAFVHEGNGLWTVNLTSGEMNGTIVGLTFSLTNAINVYFTIKTVLIDPDNATTGGLTNLSVATSALATPTNITAASGITLAGVTHTGAVIPTVSTLTGHTPQTGDNFARLGAPAGASVSADVAAVKADTAAVKTKTDFLPSATAGAAGGVFIAGTNAATAITTGLTTTFTGNLTGSAGSVTGAVGSVAGAVGSVTGNVGGNVVGSVASVAGAVGSVTARVTANTDQIAGVATSATRLSRTTQGAVLGTVGAASTVSSIVTSSLDPAAAVIDQYKGRIVTFDQGTATANLRGQSTDISANTALGVLTVTPLTTAPASGDTFTIT